MPNVEIKRLVGKQADPKTGKLLTIGWDMEQLLLDGRQIALLKPAPGAPICLLGGIQITPAERKAVEDAVTKARGGVKPAAVTEAIKQTYEVLDDESEVEND